MLKKKRKESEESFRHAAVKAFARIEFGLDRSSGEACELNRIRLDAPASARDERVPLSVRLNGRSPPFVFLTYSLMSYRRGYLATPLRSKCGACTLSSVDALAFVSFYTRGCASCNSVVGSYTL